MKLLFASRDALKVLSQCLEEHRDKLESTEAVGVGHEEAFAVWKEEVDVVRRDLEGWKLEMEAGMFGRGPVELEVPAVRKKAASKGKKLR